MWVFLYPIIFMFVYFNVWFTGTLWMVEENSKIFLDVCGYLHYAGAHLYIYISFWKLPRPVAKYDWIEKRKVSNFGLQWDVKATKGMKTWMCIDQNILMMILVKPGVINVYTFLENRIYVLVILCSLYLAMILVHRKDSVNSAWKANWLLVNFQLHFNEMTFSNISFMWNAPARYLTSHVFCFLSWSSVLQFISRFMDT